MRHSLLPPLIFHVAIYEISNLTAQEETQTAVIITAAHVHTHSPQEYS